MVLKLVGHTIVGVCMCTVRNRPS